MTDTIQLISRSLGADVQTLATISQNVANMHTPGYRAARPMPSLDGSTEMATALDQQDGSVSQTGEPLDLALRGPGFFTVERNGQPLLTRSGVFHLDAEGALVTASGDKVLGDSGVVQLATARVRVDAHGEIWDGTQSLGRLRIVEVADPVGLRPAGNGAFAYEGRANAWNGTVSQGAIEHANVDPAGETIHLMETTRHAESVQRAISIYDKAMDAGINHLGEN